MTTISGLWRINGNGSQGTLVLSSDDNVHLSGTVAFDDTGGRGDAVSGTWDDAAGRIAFTRRLPGGAVQNYVGFLGDNHPPRLILAGNFTESDIPPGSPRSQFGWAAFTPFGN
jgi:hypothetical protein